MNKNKVSDVLNNSLLLLDDVCFLMRQFFSIDFVKKYGRLPTDEEFIGMLSHYKELRQHIVNEAVSGDFDTERFCAERMEDHFEIFKNLSWLPFSLFSWNHYSRRVLSLSQDMQMLLSATSLEGFTWRDFKLPFESFVVVLAEPIVGLGNQQYDCVLINRVVLDDSDENWFLSFILFPSDFDKYKSLDKAKIARSVKRGRAKERKIHNKRLHLAGGIVDAFDFHFKIDSNVSLPDAVEAVSQPLVGYKHAPTLTKNRKIGCNSDEDEYIAYSVYSKVFHLILNICFYMAFIPPQQVNRSHARNGKDVQSNPISAITCPNEIFAIGSENDISDTAREAMYEITKSRESGGKCVHWRRGHWRRKWGSYGDENAPKTWVSPCLVNRSKLPDKSLPTASMSNL